MSGKTCDLKTCSRCRCTLMLSEYFEKNRKGEYYKLCNGCRGRGRTNNDNLGKSITVIIMFAKSAIISIVSIVGFRLITGLGFVPRVVLVASLIWRISTGGY